MSNHRNSTTAPAVSTGNEVSFESLIARLNAATAAANSLSVPLADTAEEAELHAAVDEITESQASIVSYDGVLQALRLAVKENKDFQGSDVSVAAVAATLRFLEKREAELPVDRVERLAIELSETLPQWANGQFMAMVYPAGDVRGYWLRSIRFDRSNEPDPVVAALQAYNDGNKAFEAIGSANFDQHGGEEAVIAKTYGPPMEVIDAWDKPCTTREGAIAALRHVLDECDAFSCSDSLTAMTRAALLYLEGAPE